MKQMKRALCVLLALSIAVSLMTTVTMAAGFSDTKSHWAKSYIDEGVKAGYISGYTDGSFRPNNSVTRGAFCKILNKALGLEATSSIAFSDLNSGNTFYSEVQKAVYAGYISGYTDNTFRPSKTITRQEAAVMLSRILGEPVTKKSLNTLKDNASIASYAKDGVQKVVSKGYIAGDASGRFNPNSPLTRGQTAKIISMLLKSERVVRDSVTFTTSGKTYSNNIYVGPLTVSLPANGTVTFDNCMLLGLLTVKSGSKINLSDTAVVAMSVGAGSGATITASGSAGVKGAYLSGGASLTESGLTGSGFNAVALSGSALKNETVSLRGAFTSVDVSSPSAVSLLSGSIASLNVSSGAAGSAFALSSGTNVASATLNGKCSFTGSGTITTAQQNVSGITYQTAPGKVTGSVPAVTATLAATPTPANGATGVSVGSNIKLQFGEAVYNAAGKALTASMLKNDVLELRRGSASGTKVAFTASISTNKQQIVLSPDSDLLTGTTYYVILLADSIENADGKENSRQVFSFTTTGKSNLVPSSMDPEDGDTGVAISVAPTLTFGESIYDASYSGTRTPTSSVLGKAFRLYENSVSSKNEVDTSVSISGKKVTITPDSELELDTTYYIVLEEGYLKNSSGKENSYQKYSFTTSSTAGFVRSVSPSNGATGVAVSVTPKLTLFSSSVYDADYSSDRTPTSSALGAAFKLYRGSVSSKYEVDARVSLSGKTVTITPDGDLDAGYTYYIVLNEKCLKDSSGNKNTYQKFSFTTTSSSKPTVSITSSTTAADPKEAITLRFSEKMYQSGGNALTDSYAASYVKLYQGSTKVSCSVSVSSTSSRTTVTITPNAVLANNTAYKVTVSSGAFCNYSGTAVAGTTLTLTTKSLSAAVSDIAAASPTLSSLAVSFRASMTGSARVQLKRPGADVSVEKTVSSVTAGVNTTAVFDELLPGTAYDVIIYMTFSDKTEKSFTGKVSTSAPTIRVDAASIATDSATITVRSDYYDGDFSVTYAASGDSGTLQCPASTASPFSIPMQGLTPGKDYTVTVSLSYGGDSAAVGSVRFSTDAISTDAGLYSVSLTGAPCTVSGTDLNVTAEPGAALTVTATAASTTATVSINGETAEDGESSADVSAADGASVSVRVTAQDGVTSQEYTYTIHLTAPTPNLVSSDPPASV